jgi:probable DNA repair protein
VLEDLAAIGARMGPRTAGDALRTLRALLERRVLRLPPSDSAVTLCGALADPIVRYDGIWITGLHAEAWPPPAQLDPFIPAPALRRARVPAANPAARLAQAREVLRRCRLAARHLVASWPAHGDEGEHLPSPLLAEWGVTRSATIDVPLDSLVRSIRASRRVEAFEDGRGEPWPARRTLPSGSRAIEYQSRCAFRAYAELRLASAPLKTPRPGVGPLDRGRLLHKALELAWRTLGSSHALEAASRDGTLAQLIESCVQRAGDETLPAPADAAARAAQRRERRRAARLLGELAELERQRPPFRVLATEARRRIEIEGAALEVRIDRIDELDDGALALFDYKTGHTGAVDWLAARVGNPQLLVYTLAADGPPAALAMIRLASRRIAYRGMADRRDRLPKISAPLDAAHWREQLGRWRELVGRFAQDFLEGNAEVDPLGGACTVCHLHAFCRIAEVSPAAAVAEDGCAAESEGSAGGTGE